MICKFANFFICAFALEPCLGAPCGPQHLARFGTATQHLFGCINKASQSSITLPFTPDSLKSLCGETACGRLADQMATIPNLPNCDVLMSGYSFTPSELLAAFDEACSPALPGTPTTAPETTSPSPDKPEPTLETSSPIAVPTTTEPSPDTREPVHSTCA